jgi:hypothetical protein
MFQLDVPLMLLESDVHGAARLPSLDPAALAGNLADSWCLVVSSGMSLNVPPLQAPTYRTSPPW